MNEMRNIFCVERLLLPATLILSVIMISGVSGFTDSTQAGLTGLEVTCVDDQATGLGTFQSTNQKVVANRHGIFMTHLRSRNEAFTAQTWRLSRSTDSGCTFQTIYESTDGTNPPCVETDEEGNIHLVRLDFNDGRAYYYRFLAENDFRNPSVSSFPSPGTGKNATCYDNSRKQIYYFANNGWFYVLKSDGTVSSSLQLAQFGAVGRIMYTLLTLDTDGTLYAAWTTQKHGVYLYWSIHCIKSTDGGKSWLRLDNTPLNVPIVDDPEGPTDEITSEDEHEVHTWLASLLAKDGKLHFMYMAQFNENVQRYCRYDIAAGQRDIGCTSGFRGDSLGILGLDGAFVSQPSVPGSPLYALGWEEVKEKTEARALVCLASDDNGESWYDYARTDVPYKGLYAIGACRRLTKEGLIVGSFTESGTSPPRVHFFRIQAGIAAADIAQIESSGNTTRLTLKNVRGHPVQIRFKRTDGSTTSWNTFSESISVLGRPTHYQLKSSLGVVSAEYLLKE